MQISAEIQEENIKKTILKKKSAKSVLWYEKPVDEKNQNIIKKEFCLDEVISRLLASRNITKDNFNNFFNPKIKNIMPDPFVLDQMEMATKKIVDSILKKKKIGIFGDYDVDGSTSTAIISKYFLEIGVDFEFYIPDRIKEGYGPNLTAFKFLKNKGCDLIITLDCGTTANNEINLISKNGVNVIIVDHHKEGVGLPDAYAIVNPNKKTDKSGLKNLCAAGVTFFLIVAINRELKKTNFLSNNIDLLEFLDLVALGTICDIVNLDTINRAFVKQGLKIFNNSSNIGLLSILNEASIEDKVSCYHLGFIIGPRINAGGRVGKSSLGAELLLTSNENLAQVMAQKLSEYNNLRKKIEKKVENEAISRVDNNKKIICVHSKDWHPGVIGIVASKLTEKYNKPSIVISEDGDLCKASCRSIKGFDIGNLILEAVKKSVIESGGGHKMAGGFTIKKDNLVKLLNFLESNRFQNSIDIKKSYDCELRLSSINSTLFKNIEKFSPFGPGNPTPKFLVKDCLIKFERIVGEIHLSCIVEDIFGNKIKAIAFNAVKNNIYQYIKKENDERLQLVVTLKQNYWNGEESIQLQIEDVI